MSNFDARLRFVIVLPICIIGIAIQGGLTLIGNNEDCGPYDFRCESDKEFRLCTYFLEENETEKQPYELHRCGEGTYCDEDNPSFCSVDDAFFDQQTTTTAKTDINCSGSKDQKSFQSIYDNVDEYGEEDYYDASLDENTKSNVNNEKRKINNEHTISNKPINNVGSNENTRKYKKVRMIEQPGFDEDDGEDADSDDVQRTTEPPKTGSGSICKHYGYSADTSNKTLFWLCDFNGPLSKTLVLHHMICLDNRIFDASLRECVLRGTTRTIRDPKILPILNKQSVNNLKINNLTTTAIAHRIGLKKMIEPPINTDLEVSVSHVKDESENINCKLGPKIWQRNSCTGYAFCHNDQIFRMNCPNSCRFNEKTALCEHVNEDFPNE